MQGNPNAMVQFVPLIFIFVVFYFLIIRPQMKKQKAHQAMISNLKKNDEVVTSGGIHGTIINIKDKTFVVRIDDNAKIEIDKHCVSYVKKQRV
ncbi:MAG: preprotein translocase subunit YajC [Candidatus Omnitrophota bacterium]|nr:MAG: preprotein translocase subunit YajC [Candidatus Omnitrophota bacterium]